MYTARLLTAVIVFCATAVGPAWSAQPRTEHTFALAAGEERPRATLDDASWLVGAWEGTAFGQRFEEVWNAPSAGSMMGMFKLYEGEQVVMYEILTITIEEGSLSMKVKHFNEDFTAWEDKGDFVNFRLVALESDALHFGGISFYRKGPDRIEAYIVMKEKGGIKEYPLSYQRILPAT